MQLWTPSEGFKKASNMNHFCEWLAENRDLKLGSYADLWQWSVDNVGEFWKTIWDYYEVMDSGNFKFPLQKPAEGMIGSQWFEGSRLNYAEHIFRNASAEYPAIIFKTEDQETVEISWTELEDRVARLAGWMREKGIAQGDRVVNFMPNIPEAVIAFLATQSLGAIWSSCSPDFGVSGVVDRFQQIEPKLLFAVDGYAYGGKSYDRAPQVQQIITALPSLEQVILVDHAAVESAPILGTDSLKISLWPEVQSTDYEPLTFAQLPFSHPIWVLYSSGTTGKPKAITQSVGGCLIEHLKALGLHQDVKKGDRFFWYSTTGWMMWNYAVASLLAGGTMVIYDGSAGYPDINSLWDFAQKSEINHFGGGASFYVACMKAGLSFEKGSFPKLRSIGSTGSPLPPEGFEWLYREIKSDLWVVSLSGGTDICSGFVGGSPLLPVDSGEIQCRMLGCKVEAFNDDGKPVIEELGEMVITEPMPSMPIYFWQDTDNQRYKSSYFEMYPSLWRHGDWIKITDRDSVIIFGRSDATLNRGGVRIGTAEIYNTVEALPQVADSLVVCVEKEGGEFYMPLYIVTAEGYDFDDKLKKIIVKIIRQQYSPRHVPDAILQVSQIPYTISGKKMETPVKKILMGISPEKAATKDAMRNPEALKEF